MTKSLQHSKDLLSISSSSKQFLLGDLLPYDPQVKTQSRIKDGLKEYGLLLKAAEHSTELIKQGKISSFDPLVGENACQIRALKLSLIFTNHPIDYECLSQRVLTAKKRLEILNSSISEIMKKDLSLQDLFTKENLNIELTYNEWFLIKSYLLTQVKTLKPPKEDMPFIKNEYTDVKKLKEINPVGTMFAENLVKKLRTLASASSVSFVKELANSSIFPDSVHNMISSNYSVEHRRLHCLPCFWVTKILVLQALKFQIPLVIVARQIAKDNNNEIVNEIPLFFKSNSQKYQETCPSIFNPETPALVLLVSSYKNTNDFSNIENWKRDLLRYDPIDLILAYAAVHRQYPDESKDSLILQTQDEQYAYYKQKAGEWRCSVNNPSRFFLSHAFCDKIGNTSNHVILKDETPKTIKEPDKIMALA